MTSGHLTVLSVWLLSHIYEERKRTPFSNKRNLPQNIERETKQLGLVVDSPGNSKSGNHYPVDKI